MVHYEMVKVIIDTLGLEKNYFKHGNIISQPTKLDCH